MLTHCRFRSLRPYVPAPLCPCILVSLRPYVLAPLCPCTFLSLRPFVTFRHWVSWWSIGLLQSVVIDPPNNGLTNINHINFWRAKISLINSQYFLCTDIPIYALR